MFVNKYHIHENGVKLKASPIFMHSANVRFFEAKYSEIPLFNEFIQDRL